MSPLEGFALAFIILGFMLLLIISVSAIFRLRKFSRAELLTVAIFLASLAFLIFLNPAEGIQNSLITYAVMAAVVLMSLGIYQYDQKIRRQNVKKLATFLGFKYDEDSALNTNILSFSISEKPGNSNSNVRLFRGGRRYNTIFGKRNGRIWEISDYDYTEGKGTRNTVMHRQTLFAAPISKNTSRFILCHEGFFEKIQDIFLKNDIDFPEYPLFSKKYLLRGENLESIRKLFQPELIRHLEKISEPIALESNGTSLSYYISEKRLDPKKPEEWNKELDKASRIADLLEAKK